MHPKLADAFADRLGIARIAESERTDPDGDLRSCPVIAESRESA
jgi:hypothetical protein